MPCWWFRSHDNGSAWEGSAGGWPDASPRPRRGPRLPRPAGAEGPGGSPDGPACILGRRRRRRTVPVARLPPSRRHPGGSLPPRPGPLDACRLPSLRFHPALAYRDDARLAPLPRPRRPPSPMPAGNPRRRAAHLAPPRPPRQGPGRPAPQGPRARPRPRRCASGRPEGDGAPPSSSARASRPCSPSWLPSPHCPPPRSPLEASPPSGRGPWPRGSPAPRPRNRTVSGPGAPPPTGRWPAAPEHTLRALAALSRWMAQRGGASAIIGPCVSSTSQDRYARTSTTRHSHWTAVDGRRAPDPDSGGNTTSCCTRRGRPARPPP